MLRYHSSLNIKANPARQYGFAYNITIAGFSIIAGLSFMRRREIPLRHR